MECKNRITEWIKDNPGYVHSQFTFVKEREDEELPTSQEFEKLMHEVDSWIFNETNVLSEEEQELYPGATYRQKYIFEPLDGNLYAHLFLSTDDDILYVVVCV